MNPPTKWSVLCADGSTHWKFEGGQPVDVWEKIASLDEPCGPHTIGPDTTLILEASEGPQVLQAVCNAEYPDLGRCTKPFGHDGEHRYYVPPPDESVWVTVNEGTAGAYRLQILASAKDVDLGSYKEPERKIEPDTGKPLSIDSVSADMKPWRERVRAWCTAFRAWWHGKNQGNSMREMDGYQRMCALEEKGVDEDEDGKMVLSEVEPPSEIVRVQPEYRELAPVKKAAVLRLVIEWAQFELSRVMDEWEQTT